MTFCTFLCLLFIIVLSVFMIATKLWIVSDVGLLVRGFAEKSLKIKKH